MRSEERGHKGMSEKKSKKRNNRPLRGEAADLPKCLHTLIVVATGDLRDDVVDCGRGGGHSRGGEDDGGRRVLDEPGGKERERERRGGGEGERERKE